MEFIEFTQADNNQPCYINKNQIVSFHSLDSNTGHTIISLTISFQTTVKESLEEVKKLLNVNQTVKVQGTGGWTKS